MSMTMTRARELGWTVERGAYIGTCDDRADRWYAYKLGTYDAIDRRGRGHRTRRDALNSIDDAERGQS